MSLLCLADEVDKYLHNFKPELFLEIIDAKNNVILCKFRTTTTGLKLNSEDGKISKETQEICLLCDTNGIGDAFHHISQCQYLEQNPKKPNIKLKHIRTATKTRGSQEPVIAHLVFNFTSKVNRKWGCYT